jgi:hypothetical protein
MPPLSTYLFENRANNRMRVEILAHSEEEARAILDSYNLDSSNFRTIQRTAGVSKIG